VDRRCRNGCNSLIILMQYANGHVVYHNMRLLMKVLKVRKEMLLLFDTLEFTEFNH